METGTKSHAKSLLRILMLTIVVMTVTVSAIFAAFLAYYRATDMKKETDSRLLVAVEMYREIIGTKFHDSIDGPNSISKDKFDSIVNRNNDLCRKLDLQYLWSVIQIKNGDIVFTSATNSNVNDPQSSCAKFFETHQDPESYTAALSHEMMPTFSSFKNEWGAGRQVLLPGIDSHGRIFIYGASIKLSKYEAILEHSLLTAIVIWLSVMCIALPVTLAISRHIVRPIEALTKAADEMALGNLKTELPVANIDELDSLSVSFDRMRSELNKQTKNLRESEEKFSKAFQSAPLLLTIASVGDGRFLDVNDAFVSITGYSRDIAIGSRSTEIGFVQIEERNRMLDILKSEGRVKNIEIKTNRVDGSQMICLYSAEIINLNGQMQLLSTAIDITDIKQNEKAIIESEERYRKVVNTAPYGIQLTDREGKILFSNPAHHKIQGYDDGELVGRYIWELMADENLRSRAKDYYQKILKEQPIPEVYYNRDITKDGREIDVQVNWDFLRNQKGTIEGIISIISDITKQKALESSIQQAQKMESIGNLAGGIAHDFNNILFPIVGLAEMLVEDLPSESIEKSNAQEILHAGKRGADLVKQILAFSRQHEHKLIPTRIQQVMKEVLKLSRASIPMNIQISQNIQQECGLVLADATQLHQIGMNLITNAYHAVEDKGGQIHVQVNDVLLGDDATAQMAIQPGKYAMLSVTDNGVGIPPANLKKIFDPYFTTKGVGKGTGLGLAVVYGIIKEHKGDIKVHSEVGKGTTFEVYLPLMKTQEASEEAGEQLPVSVGTERILIVDDEPPIAKLEKQMLERLGYSVSVRSNSVDALDDFKANPDAYDLVITDMSMPNLTGEQLAREIFAVRPDIPIIICTGFSERLSENTAKAMGIKGFLLKPIIKSAMAKEVRRMLDETKMLR